MEFKNIYTLQIVIIIGLALYSNCIALQQVDDTQLVRLLTEENNVIAFFTKKNCPVCDKLESVINNIQIELKDHLGAVIVKALDSHMVGIYNPAGEPTLIYFRRGIPLLYYGDNNEEHIFRFFLDNREPVVKELSDDNFEHLTQASTGSTTGDWFIFFYSAECVLSQRLYAVWEAVGAYLRLRLNVARVNRMTSGISTAKRFHIQKSPEFIFLRQGKVFRFNSMEYTPKRFIEFVQSGYKEQTNPENVPPIPSIMNEFLKEQFDVIRKSSILKISILIAFLSTVLAICISKCKPKNKQNSTKKAK